MNNDELATRRAQAIAEDRCFSKGRLRDEFRMKPAPGAEPVKWYKNTYGGRALHAVYGRGVKPPNPGVSRYSRPDVSSSTPPARPVLTRDMERVLERSGEAPVYWPNLHASFRLREDAGFVPSVQQRVEDITGIQINNLKQLFWLYIGMELQR